MPMLKDAIDRMNVAEKFQVMDYLWESLSRDNADIMPAWHLEELRATEARVAAGVEHPIPWESAKAILNQMA